MTDVYIPEVRHLPIDELEPSAWNPNELKGEDFDRLVQEISEVGFIDFPQVVPIVDGSYRIIGGQHRWQAARALGLTTIPCIVLSDERWQESDLQKFVTVRLNMLRGQQNPEKMLALFREMTTKYGETALRRLFAYTDMVGWKKLVNQAKKATKAAGLPKGLREKFEERASNVSTASDLGDVLQHLMAQYGDTLEHSFMVFSYGGKEHLYVAMSKKTKKQMDRVVEVCSSWGLDMNEVMAEVVKKWLEEAEKREHEEIAATSE